MPPLRVGQTLEEETGPDWMWYGLMGIAVALAVWVGVGLRRWYLTGAKPRVKSRRQRILRSIADSKSAAPQTPSPTPPPLAPPATETPPPAAPQPPAQQQQRQSGAAKVARRSSGSHTPAVTAKAATPKGGGQEPPKGGGQAGEGKKGKKKKGGEGNSESKRGSGNARRAGGSTPATSPVLAEPPVEEAASVDSPCPVPDPVPAPATSPKRSKGKPPTPPIVEEEPASPPAWPVGATVEAEWEGEWLPAEVTGCSTDEVAVLWDDGTTSNLALEQVRVPVAAPEPASAAAAPDTPVVAEEAVEPALEVTAEGSLSLPAPEEPLDGSINVVSVSEQKTEPSTPGRKEPSPAAKRDKSPRGKRDGRSPAGRSSPGGAAHSSPRPASSSPARARRRTGATSRRSDSPASAPGPESRGSDGSGGSRRQRGSRSSSPPGTRGAPEGLCSGELVVSEQPSPPRTPPVALPMSTHEVSVPSPTAKAAGAEAPAAAAPERPAVVAPTAQPFRAAGAGGPAADQTGGRGRKANRGRRKGQEAQPTPPQEHSVPLSAGSLSLPAAATAAAAAAAQQRQQPQQQQGGSPPQRAPLGRQGGRGLPSVIPNLPTFCGQQGPPSTSPPGQGPVHVERTPSLQGVQKESPAQARPASNGTAPWGGSGGGGPGVLPMCTSDKTCLMINDPQHQRQFRHTCKLRDCQYANQPWHTRLFVHPPPSQSASKGVEGDKHDDSSESPELSGRIVVYNLADRSYLQLKGNWARVKLSKLRAQVEQCMHIPKRFQRFQLQDDASGDREFVDDSACSACGIVPGAVLYVQSTEHAPSITSQPQPPQFAPPSQLPPQQQPPPPQRGQRGRRGEKQGGSPFQSQPQQVWQQMPPHLPPPAASNATMIPPPPGPPSVMLPAGSGGSSPPLPYAQHGGPHYYSPATAHPGDGSGYHSRGSVEDLHQSGGSGGWVYPGGGYGRDGPMPPATYGSPVPRPDGMTSSFHGGYSQGYYGTEGGQMPFQGHGWAGEYPQYPPQGGA
eukprot:Hpha_TRINITY_DN13950_c0_g2::TRINITY_DN13950_c0_g2_i1::g.35423::m.35423